jgi:lysophospholipase L1-like esterase
MLSAQHATSCRPGAGGVPTRSDPHEPVKHAVPSPILAALAGAATLCFVLVFGLARSTALSEALLWRVDGWQPLPSLTQRVFERRLTIHQLGQDRLVPAGALLLLGDSHLSTLPVGGIRQAYNFAIGGESAQRLGQRLPHYQALARARAVVVGTGTNDILEGRTPAQIEAAWSELLNQLPASARVVCVGLPWQPGAGHAASAATFDDADRRIAVQCRLRGHVFVPLWPRDAAAGAPVWAEDGLHLRPEGSRELLARIESALGDAR